jgi:tetratricopeptide (TPR) repeat protein
VLGETDVSDEKDSGLGVHTENMIDEMNKNEGMAALVESIVVWRAQHIAWNMNIYKAETLLFHLVFKENSQNPQAMDLLARIYFQQGKYEKARDLWNKALALQPGNPTLRRAAAEMQNMSKSPGSAVARYRIGIVLNCILLLLIISIAGLWAARGYNELTEWAGETPTVAIRNIEEHLFDDHYRKYASTYKDNIASKFDYFIPYPFSSLVAEDDEGKSVLGQVSADLAEDEEARGIESTKEEALLKVPGMSDIDLSGLVTNRAYRVKKGDSLWTIAKKIYGRGTAWELIAKANGIRNQSKLKVGQELVLPREDEIIPRD